MEHLRGTTKLITAAVLLVLLGLLGAACTFQPQPIPELSAPTDVSAPFTTPRANPLVCPVLPNDPSQAQLGSVTYCNVCMACHGDVGQGLALWQQKLQPPDNDCFRSGCHAAHHPPGGFVFPNHVPAIIGPGKLDRFKNALALHDYLKAKMPWWRPGYLTDDEYWQLTAFLLEANGVDLHGQTLDATNAAQITIATK